MKRKTGAKNAMAELLQKSNETQTSIGNINRPINNQKAKPASKARPSNEKPDQVTGNRKLIREPAQNSRTESKASEPFGKNAPTGRVASHVREAVPRKKSENMRLSENTKLQSAGFNKGKTKKSKSFWYGFAINFSKRAAAYLIIAVVAVVIIASATVIAINLPEKEEAPDGVIGRSVKETSKLESFEIKDSDDTLHDGRFYVSVNVFEGAQSLFSTASMSVGELLSEMNITMGEGYFLRESEADIISSDYSVNIDKVTYGTAEVSENIPFETKYVDVQTVPRGQTRVSKEGENGVRTAFYNVTYVNGVETERVLTDEKVTKSPVNRVVNRGVGGTFTSGGKTYSYSYYIDCKTTVYTGGGITASGLPATEAVIAVDPRVIKLGTKVYVEDPYCYVGFRTAADTGGSIKGNFIDIYFDEDNPSLWGYGIRRARVYILD